MKMRVTLTKDECIEAIGLYLKLRNKKIEGDIYSGHTGITGGLQVDAIDLVGVNQSTKIFEQKIENEIKKKLEEELPIKLE